MSDDRDLIDTIKWHFARKSSAQLREILESTDRERWSAEAREAACEVLQERSAGLSQEPEAPEEERPPPPYHYEPADIPLGVLSALVLGHGWIRYYKRVDQPPDVPLPFGPKIAWLALDSTDTGAVAAALGLRETRAATWAEGIEAAYGSAVYVTPPLADWTLAASTSLFPPDRADAFKPLLRGLSRRFGEAQYFCSHRDVGLQIWARARRGQLLRGYGWLGKESLVLWDEGKRTREERDLGFRFPDGSWEAIQQGQKLKVTGPDEQALMQLASYWSIDPTGLNRDFKEPSTGLLGSAPWAEERGRP